MPQDLIERIIEAALLASSQPLSLAQLQALFPEEQPAPSGSIEQALAALAEGCATRGIELVEVASGFRFQVKAEVHAHVARLWTERQSRYSRALLETLALIAYRQPITRGEIEQIRGVAVATSIVKTLEEREWVRVVGHRDVPGKPALYGTTKAFLDYFGLKRLDELPPLAEVHDLPELEPQLTLEPVPGATPSDDAMLRAVLDAGDAPDADADADVDRDDRADREAGTTTGPDTETGASSGTASGAGTRANGEATDDTASDAPSGGHAATASAPQADDVTDPHPESADGAAPRAAADAHPGTTPDSSPDADAGAAMHPARNDTHD